MARFAPALYAGLMGRRGSPGELAQGEGCGSWEALSGLATLLFAQLWLIPSGVALASVSQVQAERFSGSVVAGAWWRERGKRVSVDP